MVLGLYKQFMEKWGSVGIKRTLKDDRHTADLATGFKAKKNREPSISAKLPAARQTHIA